MRRCAVLLLLELFLRSELRDPEHFEPNVMRTGRTHCTCWRICYVWINQSGVNTARLMCYTRYAWVTLNPFIFDQACVQRADA